MLIKKFPIHFRRKGIQKERKKEKRKKEKGRKRVATLSIARKETKRRLRSPDSTRRAEFNYALIRSLSLSLSLPPLFRSVSVSPSRLAGLEAALHRGGGGLHTGGSSQEAQVLDFQ